MHRDAVQIPEPPPEDSGVRSTSWHLTREHPLVTLARNVSTRYVLILINVLIGLVMLRFNVQHLGRETWGLWMLAAQVTGYFTVLDLGYGSAVVKVVAEVRARRDARALIEVLSTMAHVFSAIGVACYALAIVVAALLPYIFNLAPEQESTGRLVLLMTALQVALYFHFSVYGGVINGFEKYYLNNLVGMVFNLATAAVNVAVLWLGYGLVELVACTTVLRIVPLWIYRRNAFKVFPQLEIRRHLFRRDRLRELSGFSIYVAVVDWASRIMFATDSFYLGVFLNTAAVAFYAVAQRIADTLLTLTFQLHTFMMPAVVNRAIDGVVGRQRSLMVRATRFQLALAMCFCGGVAALAGPLIHGWLGPGWENSALATQLLAVVVVLRASIAMPMTVLQGTGHHKYVAVVSASGALLNVLLSIPLVQIWGVVGVATGTVAAAALCSVLVFARACRVVGLGIWAGWRQVMFPTLWPGVVVVVVTAAADRAMGGSLAAACITLVLGGMLYAALFVMFGLDRDERQWLAGAWGRIMRGRAPQLATSDIGG